MPEFIVLSDHCGTVDNTEESLCIRGEHMNLETGFINKGRRKCHNKYNINS